MPWQIATTFHTYTVQAVTSQQTGFEANWLPLIDEHPLIRSWRSTNTAEQVITCSFGGLIVLKGLLIQNLNVASIRVTRSSNNGLSYVDINTGSPSISDIPVARHWDYRRYCKVMSANATHVQIGILPQATTDGRPHFEIGSITFPVFFPWPRAPREGLRERGRREYETVGDSKAKAGPLRLEQEFTLMLQKGLEPGLRAFALTGEDDPFAVFEDNSDSSEGRLMKYDGAIEFERYRKYQNVNNIRFRELV